MRTFFYDTWAFVALANTRDGAHAIAEECDRALEREGYVPVTTDFVLDETLTCLHAAGGARVATTFADALLARVEAGELLLAEVSASRRGLALGTFRKLAPVEPRLSFTDCTSFAVMRELGIELAFTADRHFHRAGEGIRPLFEQEKGRLALRFPE